MPSPSPTDAAQPRETVMLPLDEARRFYRQSGPDYQLLLRIHWRKHYGEKYLNKIINHEK
jgi:hypothetical protein